MPAAMRIARQDVVAGLTVAGVGAPQCIAYAMMAGLPPVYGLVTACVPAFVAAVSSRARWVITGPTNTTSLLILAALLPHLTAQGVVDMPGLAALGTLTLLTGLFRLGLASFGGETLVRFLPESVLVGFTAGVAVLMVVMQLDEALGVQHVVATGVFSELTNVIVASMNDNPPQLLAMLVTLGTLAGLITLQPRYPRVPFALLILVGSSLVAYVFDLDASVGLPLISDKTALAVGVPKYALPSLDPRIIESFFTPAAAIALIGTLELTAVLRVDGLKINMRREIRAQAYANIAGSLVSALPASASLTRSALLKQTPNTTRMAPIITAIATIPLVVAAPLLGYIPQATIAGLLFATAYQTVDHHKIHRIWVASRKARIVLLVTLGSALLFRLEWAIISGTAFSLILYLMDSAVPRLRVYVPTSTSRLLPYTRGDQAEVVIIEVSGELHFAAAQAFLAEVYDLVPKSVRHVVLDLTHAHAMRFTALVAFEELAADLKKNGAALYIAGVSGEFVDVLRKSKSTLNVTPSFDEPGRSVQEALRRFRDPEPINFSI